MIRVTALLFLFCLTAAPATAANPWDTRYQDRPAPATEVAPGIGTASGGGFSVTYDEVEDAISRVMVDEGAGDKVKAVIQGRQIGPAATGGGPISLEVDQLTFDVKEKTWQATLYFTSGGKPLAPREVRGRFETLADVPVLTERVRNGEVIDAADIEMTSIDTDRLHDSTIMTAKDIIGKTPRRSISPNRAIRSEELLNPPVVHKGDRVTMQYVSAAMQIKTIGEAMADGAERDIISVRNSDSQVTVQAEIIAPGVVQVLPVGNRMKETR